MKQLSKARLCMHEKRWWVGHIFDSNAKVAWCTLCGSISYDLYNSEGSGKKPTWVSPGLEMREGE